MSSVVQLVAAHVLAGGKCVQWFWPDLHSLAAAGLCQYQAAVHHLLVLNLVVWFI